MGSSCVFSGSMTGLGPNSTIEQCKTSYCQSKPYHKAWQCSDETMLYERHFPLMHVWCNFPWHCCSSWNEINGFCTQLLSSTRHQKLCTLSWILLSRADREADTSLFLSSLKLQSQDLFCHTSNAIPRTKACTLLYGAFSIRQAFLVFIGNDSLLCSGSRLGRQ